ncbi:hypothetical protein YC2023_072273 [Brassica napus]
MIDTSPRSEVLSNRRISAIVVRKLYPNKSFSRGYDSILCSDFGRIVHKLRKVLFELSSVQTSIRGGSVQVKISPVQSRRPLGFGQVLSDQPAASCLEHCELACVGVISVSSASYPAGSRKPLIRWIGKTQDKRCHVLWLSITRRCNVAVTQWTLGCRAVTRMTVGRGRLKVPSSGLCGREIGYCR